MLEHVASLYDGFGSAAWPGSAYMKIRSRAREGEGCARRRWRRTSRHVTVAASRAAQQCSRCRRQACMRAGE